MAKTKKQRVSLMEIEELAIMMLGLNEDAELDEIEEGLNEKYNTDIDGFSLLVQDLLQFTPVMGSSLTGAHYHVFGVSEGELIRAIVKVEIESE